MVEEKGGPGGIAENYRCVSLLAILQRSLLPLLAIFSASIIASPRPLETAFRGSSIKLTIHIWLWVKIKPLERRF